MAMTNISHLAALHSRLMRECARHAAARTEREREMRAVWIAQLQREIAAEMDFLGMDASAPPEMSEDELLAALRK